MAKSTVEFEWNDAGFHQILNSTEVAALCDQKAAQISAAAGDEFHAKHWYSNMKGGRAASLVVPNGYKGMALEANKKVLTKAAYGASIGFA